MGFLSKVFDGKKSITRKTTADSPFCIENPTIGFLNLQGQKGNILLEADRKLLSPLFKSSKVSSDVTPKCQVLFIYCDIDSKGKILGCASSIRELIKDARAYVVVVASENSPYSYIKAIGSRSNWGSNIALVIDRKAEKFALFFKKLFKAMFNGKSMLMEWVELAPQISGRDHPDAPATVMVPEAGHITFK